MLSRLERDQDVPVTTAQSGAVAEGQVNANWSASQYCREWCSNSLAGMTADFSLNGWRRRLLFLQCASQAAPARAAG